MCRTESLLSVKKSQLLASLDAALLASAQTTQSASLSSSTVSDSHCSLSNVDGYHDSKFDMDAEFAAFQVLVLMFCHLCFCMCGILMQNSAVYTQVTFYSWFSCLVAGWFINHHRSIPH